MGMTEKDTMVKELIRFLSGQLNKPEAQISTGDELKSLGLDSFRIIELVLFLEREFGISIPDHAYTPDRLKSVDTLVNMAMEFRKQ